MAQFNVETREIAVKVVYYGPALSGKTTNLQALFEKIHPKVRGRLMTARHEGRSAPSSST